jgi:elongation factor 1-gamma
LSFIKAHSQAVAGLKKSLGTLDKVLLNKTYLVGERITLADIAVATSLYLPFKLVLDAEFRKQHKNLSRWYITLINQPAFKKVLGEVTLAEVAVEYTRMSTYFIFKFIYHHINVSFFNK